MIIRDITVEQYANRQLLKTNTVGKATPLRSVEKTKRLEVESHFEGNKESGTIYNKKV